jgi:hypothetical protein
VRRLISILIIVAFYGYGCVVERAQVETIALIFVREEKPSTRYENGEVVTIRNFIYRDRRGGLEVVYHQFHGKYYSIEAIKR